MQSAIDQICLSGNYVKGIGSEAYENLHMSERLIYAR